MEPGLTEMEVLAPRGEPQAVRQGAEFVQVRAVVERWEVEVGWWRTPPARWRRLRCWRVLLADGNCLDLRREPGRSWRGRVWG